MNEKKRKNNHLTYAEQYKVLKKIKSGVSKHEILREFKISKSAFYRLIDREQIILKNIGNHETMKKKSLKSSDNKALDAAMIKWFQQARDRGAIVSGPILQEKAILLNEKLNGPSTFKVSRQIR